MRLKSPARGGDALPPEATLITTTAIPSTTAIVVAVTGASLGADHVLGMFKLSGFEGAVIFFAVILSSFTTYAAKQIPLLWRLVLWPFNFCFLVYLVISSAQYGNALKNRNENKQPPGTNHVVEQRITPNGNQQ